jgi:PleD family two-component response regulator
VPEVGRPGSLSSRLTAATRLLVVEDEIDIADFLRAYFRASGYEIVHLDPTSAAEVIEAADKEQPACILLDYGLRGFSGDEAYRLLRSDDRFAFTPVIVVTADLTARPTAASRSSGIDGFAAKPFNVNALSDLVADRVEAAAKLMSIGRDPTFDVMTQRYLDARLADELTVAAHRGGSPLAFAMLHLRGVTGVAGTSVDANGFVVREMVAFMRDRLPASAVLGHMDSDELAALVPGMTPDELRAVLDLALDEVRAAIHVPGSAGAIIDVAAGIAGYPEHAHTPDELFMAADAALADAIDAGERVRVAL